MKENRDYSVTVYANKSTRYWHVNIKIYSLPMPWRRFRPSLGVRLEEDYKPFFRKWKEETLPSLLEDRIEAAAKAVNPQVESGSPKISEIIDWYVHSHLPLNTNAKTTIPRYAQVLRAFELFCSAKHIGRMQQLSWPKIEEWQAWMIENRPAKKGAPARGKHSLYFEVSVVRRMLNLALEAGVVKEIPITKWLVKKPRGKSKFKGHSLETVQAFLQLMAEKEPQILDHCQWLIFTGWDPANMLDFDATHIDWSKKAVDWQRLKTDNNMLWPLNDDLMAIIKRRIALIGPGYKVGMKLFDLPGDERKNKVAYLHRHVSRCCVRHGFGVRVIPRDFRITFGTLHASGALNRDANGNMIPTPPAVLKELMCHSKIETTMGYYHDVDLASMAYWSARGIQAINQVPPVTAKGRKLVLLEKPS